MTEWQASIVQLAQLKEQIARLDTDGLFPYALPAVAATEGELAGCAERAGLTLDAQHRSFLAAANGWRAFFETQDLLGTEQLVAGEHRDAFAGWIESAPPQARAEGFSAASLLPVAVDLQMPLFAVMPIVDGRVATQVLSLDPSGIIDEFDSFEAYIDATITYTRRNLDDFRSGHYTV